MRAFAWVLVVAIVVGALGGFFAGELFGETFSIPGAVVGGVGSAAALLGLGSHFNAQEEERRKREERQRGWRVGHQGRDCIYYEELDGAGTSPSFSDAGMSDPPSPS